MTDDFGEKLVAASTAFREAIRQDESAQEVYWATLTPEQQLDAFCCVVRRIYRGDVVDRGSYRYVLYDVFGFGPEAYVPAQCAGYLDIHNLIYDGLRREGERGVAEVARDVETLNEIIGPENT